MDLIVRCLLLLHVFIIDTHLSTAQDVDPMNYYENGHCLLYQSSIGRTLRTTRKCKSLHLENINLTEPSQELFESIADGMDSLSMAGCNVDLVYLASNLKVFEFIGNYGECTTIIDFTAFDGMAQLEEIIIVKVTSVIISASVELPALRTLAINDSPMTLSNDTFCKFPNLEIIDLSNSSLPVIPKYFSTLTKVTQFAVNDNKLRSVSLDEFTNMTQLELLHLRLNEISELSTQNMVHLPLLRKLSLENNSLTTLNVSLWNMPALEVLDIGNNKLKQVDGLAMLFTGKRFLVETAGNPWDMEWFEKTAKQVKARRIAMGYSNKFVK